MPFSGDSYAVPAASRDDATPNTVITSADYKLLLDDLEVAFNTTTSIGRGGTGATTASGARTNLGITSLSAPAGDRVLGYDQSAGSAAYFTAGNGLEFSGTELRTTASAFALTLLDDADAAAARTTLGLGGLATLNILDEDDMASDSATRPPSQQSVKAYVDANAGSDWTETAVSTATGGTAYDVTSIPSGVTEIQVFAIQTSLSGTDDFLLQLGTGGAPVTTGYSSTGTYATASNNIVGVNSTIGFLAQGFGAAANVDLVFTLFKVPGVNTWICKHQSQGGTLYAGYGAGSVTLSGTLDMVRLSRTASTFDAMGAFFARYR